ncbi:MAG: hypothetical protein CIT03_07535 [Methanobacterium sp.]|nr:MAG: hypothetical protein CIT03_07535 [Methanobacterium sp.]
MEPRILIVEDEAITALEIKRNLHNWGYEVVGHASKGEAAIEMAQKLLPDLILMDINLQSGMNGLEASCKILEFMDIPIIFLTAHGNQDYMEKARNTGAVYYILKPFQNHELKYAVENSLIHHQLNQKLKQSEKSYRSLAANIPGIVYRFHKEQGQTEFFNNMLQEITGFTSKELNNDYQFPINSLVIDSNLDEIRTIIENALVKGEAFSLEYELKDKEGRIKRVVDKGRPTFDDYGNLKTIEGVIFEVDREI